MTGVLEGVTVLQLPSGIAGAMAGMLLADNGADVIVVEGGEQGPISCRTVFGPQNHRPRRKTSASLPPRLFAFQKTRRGSRRVEA